jgi:phage terminase large subunit-like protein
MREKVRTALQEYFPQLATHGGMLVIGTRYHRQDVYWWLQKRREEALKLHGAVLEKSDLKNYLFNVTIRSAWNTDGSLYYPVLLNEKFLMQQSIELEEYLFSVWYRNEPIEESAKIFRQIEAHEKDFDLVLDTIPFVELPNGTRRSLYVTLAWDPAGRRASKKSDFHGLTVNGNDSSDVWWTLHAEEHKLPLDAALLRIVVLVRHYHCSKVSIETRGGGMQGLYVDLLRPVMREAGLGHIEIVEWSSGNSDSKVVNIKTLQPRWNQWRWWLRKGFCEPLKHQLDNFPQLEHDDVIDTMVQQKTICRPAEPDDIDPLSAGEEAFDLEDGNGEQESVGGAWVGLGTPDYNAA